VALRTVEQNGITWTVWDVTPTSITRLRQIGNATAMEGGWLCFECDGEKRRLTPAPAGWEAWSDAQILDCLGTAPVIPRARNLGAR
jgi:hypothetical protein